MALPKRVSAGYIGGSMNCDYRITGPLSRTPILMANSDTHCRESRRAGMPFRRVPSSRNATEGDSLQVLRNFAKVCATLLTLAFSGCWQEIRYEPSQTPLPRPSTSRVAVVEEANEEVLAVPALETPTLTEEPLPREIVPVEQPVELAEISPAAEQPKSPAPPRSALATWRMASKWSYAAARLAKGQGPDRYGEDLERAHYAATLVKIELPDLPGDVPVEDREKAIIAFLTETAGPKMSRQLLNRYDAQHAALADLAIRTHVLLLTYTPKSPRLAEFLPALRRVAEDSNLPQSVCDQLITLLEERAEFKKVKAAIYQLHRQASVELGKATS